MIKKTILSASFIAALLLSLFATTQAEVSGTATDAKDTADATKKDTAKSGTDKAEVLESLKKILEKHLRVAPSSLKESKIPNLYEAMYGTEVVYVSADGKYFINGDMINLETRENVSNIAKQSVRKGIMEKQDNKPIVFKAKNEKHKLTVFTDIDCPYCAKLHREVPQLNEAGVTVEYLMFPRAGIHSNSYKKAVSVWCADDQQTALTKAKKREQIEEKTCKNPIETQYNLGQEIGVNGTPALITKSGKLIPGYVPADRLVKILEKDDKGSNN